MHIMITNESRLLYQTNTSKTHLHWHWNLLFLLIYHLHLNCCNHLSLFQTHIHQVRFLGQLLRSIASSPSSGLYEMLAKFECFLFETDWKGFNSLNTLIMVLSSSFALANSVFARLSVYICLFFQVAKNVINSMRSTSCTIYSCQCLLSP